MRARFLGATTLTAAICVLLGSAPAQGVKASPSSECPAGAAVVSVVDYAFEPATITVPPGTTVCWRNTGAVPHTVTSDTPGFDATLQPTETYQYTFDAAGQYPYHCTFHLPSMVGTIIVNTGPPPAPPPPPPPPPLPPPRPPRRPPPPPRRRPPRRRHRRGFSSRPSAPATATRSR